MDKKLLINMSRPLGAKNRDKTSSYYIHDDDLVYEIRLSKGKGFLTKKAERMFILLGKNIILKKIYFNDYDDKLDCYHTGLLHLFSNWKSYNEKKYYYAMPYFTELFKRGMAAGFNQLYKYPGTLHIQRKTFESF